MYAWFYLFAKGDFSMLEPDWNQERPTEQEIADMWKTITFIPFSLNSKVKDDMVAKIESILVNGGCIFKSFKITENKVFDWFVSRNRLDEANFFSEFLTAKEVTAELEDYIGKIYVDRLDKLEWGNAFTLDGELASLLVTGGAYERFQGTPKAAKNLAFQFCKELYEERYTDVLIYRSYEAWADWFMEIAWDTTWFILDKTNRVIHLLCVTDTD
jgi:hypothetical protein